MNAVITGATKGIGKACAEYFAEKGFNIAICARSGKDLDELALTITDIYKIKVLKQICDVSKKEEVKKFGSYCLAEYKTIDVLINNAGIFLPGNLLDEAEGTLETLIETNIYSAYHLTRVIAPAMVQNKKGHIFNLCSVASINAYDAGGSYAISKFGLLGFSKNLRHELKKYNIRVTAVLAGAVLTPSWDGTNLPKERFIDVRDVARLIWDAYDVSERTVVEEILLRPMLGDI
ncbi:MAG: SDR family oxidoreductase [Fimbriimonadaceae bacterium]|nr:SDR family oxidoreductase [Chitinophagales bacterium]